MKTPSHFIVLLLVALLPASCGRQEEVVHTESPVATETAVFTPTAPATSPLADVPDLTMLPAISVDDSKEYDLTTPSYELTHDWLKAAWETPEINSQLYYILNLLAFDFAHSFPNGAGNINAVINEIVESGPGYHLHGKTWPLLETAVVAYLNQNQISLEDEKAIDILAVNLEPTTVDWDGDGNMEWLVKVESDDLDILGVIPLTIEQSGQYTILPNTIEPVNTLLYDYHENTQVSFDFDFTGDGNIDVLQTMQGYFLGGVNGFINIYSWNNTGLYAFEKINITAGSYKPTPIFQIADFTGDGAIDVKVTTSHEVNFNCVWDEVDIYSWQNDLPQYVLMKDQTPDTAECAIFHAITPSYRYSDAAPAEKNRVELLEYALSQLSLETAPSADYLALGYFHLAMAYYEQNDDIKAQQALNQLNNLPDEASFGQLVQELYSENGGDLLGVCEQLYTSPDLAEATSISDYIYQGSITGYFGIGSEQINAEAICPYPHLVQERLAALSLPISQHPETSLAQYGYDFSSYQSVNLDADPEMEWFGLVEKEYIFLTLIDQMGEELKPMVLMSTCLECKDGFEYEIRDENRQSYVIGRLKKNIQCSNDGPFYMLPQPFLVQSEQEQFIFDTIFTFCDAVDERPLAEITASDFGPTSPNPPTWRSLLHEATGQEEWEWKEELQTAVLTQSDPAIPEKISELLTYLPTDDPEAQPYIEHLTYLLGYHYELSGDAETAVSTYLALIRQAPNSPWSWLAWARLAPVES